MGRLCSSADGAWSADWARYLWPLLPASDCQCTPCLQPPCGATCSAACTCPSAAAPLCDPRDAKCKPKCGDYWACTADCVCPSATHVCDPVTTACRPLCGAQCDSSCGCPLTKPACWGGTCKVHTCRGRNALPACEFAAMCMLAPLLCHSPGSHRSPSTPQTEILHGERHVQCQLADIALRMPARVSHLPEWGLHCEWGVLLAVGVPSKLVPTGSS